MRVASKRAAIVGEITRPKEIERRDDDRERCRRVYANWAAFVGEIERRDDDRESFAQTGKRPRERREWELGNGDRLERGENER